VQFLELAQPFFKTHVQGSRKIIGYTMRTHVITAFQQRTNGLKTKSAPHTLY